MCGIAGFVLHENEVVDAREVAHAMLREIESRGKDACGVSWADKNGKVWWSKLGTTASKALFEIDRDARVIICHTRQTTQGSHLNELNNHPIHIRRQDGSAILGIHNGMIANDDEIFTDLKTIKRQAEVDSEAIFALIAEKGIKAIDEIEGSMAIAWIDSRSPYRVHLARGKVSPLIVAKTAKGSTFFGSTLAVCNVGIAKGGLGERCASHRELKVGSHLSVRGGRERGHFTFTPKTRTYSHNPRSYDSYTWEDRHFIAGEGWVTIARGAPTGKEQRSTYIAPNQRLIGLHCPASAVPEDFLLSETAYWTGVYSRMGYNDLWAEFESWDEAKQHLIDKHTDQVSWIMSKPCDDCAVFGCDNAVILERDIKHGMHALMAAIEKLEADDLLQRFQVDNQAALDEADRAAIQEAKEEAKIAEVEKTNPVRAAAMKLLRSRLDSSDVTTVEVPSGLDFSDAALFADEDQKAFEAIFGD